MTSTTFFFVFIPILALILLLVNILLAPHNSYQEKNSVFECGFHSFLGQNRTQFSISFFIFGLLFLLFDLEILLVYPYSVSGYTNDIYGLAVMMIFFVLLTLGFIFELGKNALSIDSRQMKTSEGNYTSGHSLITLTKQLRSDSPLVIIIMQVDSLLPQLCHFINQFQSTVTESGVNVITDKVGNMSIDVPQSMTDDVAEKTKMRLGIIDRLITTRGQEIHGLLNKGMNMENQMILDNPDYKTQLKDRILEFQRLSSSYNH